MKKSILNLNGALELSKKEQKTINGGTVVDPKSCVGKSEGEACGGLPGYICCTKVCISQSRPACNTMGI
jgi:hypothetical protein